MKFLVLVAVVIAVLWIARHARRRVTRAEREPPRETREAMVGCAQCGLHLPASEALPGRGGVFCCAAHRGAYEREHEPGR
jgi:uncharacterized protein